MFEEEPEEDKGACQSVCARVCVCVCVCVCAGVTGDLEGRLLGLNTGAAVWEGGVGCQWAADLGLRLGEVECCAVRLGQSEQRCSTAVWSVAPTLDLFPFVNLRCGAWVRLHTHCAGTGKDKVHPSYAKWLERKRRGAVRRAAFGVSVERDMNPVSKSLGGSPLPGQEDTGGPPVGRRNSSTSG